MLAFLSRIWVWHWQYFLEQWYDVDVPLLLVTFDFCHTPLTLTLAHLVNDVEDPGAIAGNVRLEVSLSACEGLVIVWSGVAPPTRVVSCVGSCGGMALMSLHAF